MARVMPGAPGRLLYAARMRRKPISLAARLRMWWQDFVIHVLFEGGEICQDCGRDYPLWAASDDLYAQVYGSKHGLLCPRCFDHRATRLGITVKFCAMEWGVPG